MSNITWRNWRKYNRACQGLLMAASLLNWSFRKFLITFIFCLAGTQYCYIIGDYFRFYFFFYVKSSCWRTIPFPFSALWLFKVWPAESRRIWDWLGMLHLFLGKGKLRPYYKIRLLEQEYVLKVVFFMKQRNMIWQLKHKFIIPNLQGPFPCCRPKILFSFRIRCDWASWHCTLS